MLHATTTFELFVINSFVFFSFVVKFYLFIFFRVHTAHVDIQSNVNVCEGATGGSLQVFYEINLPLTHFTSKPYFHEWMRFLFMFGSLHCPCVCVRARTPQRCFFGAVAYCADISDGISLMWFLVLCRGGSDNLLEIEANIRFHEIHVTMFRVTKWKWDATRLIPITEITFIINMLLASRQCQTNWMREQPPLAVRISV